MVVEPKNRCERTLGAAASDAPSLLIVDDEELTCWALGKSLQGAGWAVRCAHSAEEGWEKLTEAAVDIVVSDVGLPGEDGIAFIARVRDRWPATRCFTITAAWSDAVRVRAEAAGAVAALPKPLDLDAFKRMVAAVGPKGRVKQGGRER